MSPRNSDFVKEEGLARDVSVSMVAAASIAAF
jgi:hypothetical protein